MPLEQNTDCVPKENAITFFQPYIIAEAESKPEQKQAAILDMLVKYTVLKDKLIWCLDTLCSQYSLQSSNSKLYQFTAMFPNSKVACEFRSGKTKCG